MAKRLSYLDVPWCVAEWEIENIEMAVPISPEELRAKRNSI